MARTVLLIILDGFGIGRDDQSNPIYMAQPETLRMVREEYPTTSLHASGISIGLPWGEVGNSEVGHLTIGAGKVLYQYYPRIVMSIRDQSFFENPALAGAFSHALAHRSAVNFLGLLSRGNVHASLEHLLALIRMAEQRGVNYKLHLFADGKDTPPSSIRKFLREIPFERLATLTGRYYAMDREENWQLTKRAYDNLVHGDGELVQNPEELETAIKANEARGNNEEYLPPLSFGKEKVIGDNEAILFFNYREDSIRQLSESFILPKFDKFPVKKFQNSWITTFSQYEERFNVPVAFPAETIEHTLGEVLAANGKTQLRVAETYKYAHVTYFFNNYREEPYQNEYRVLIPSLTSPHIEQHPEMMASAISDRLIQALENQSFDFILANYANPDAIAHTGDYEASIKAVKIIDHELGRVLKAIHGTPAALVITSDHGNMEEVINPFTSLPETQHDPNPVPFHLVAPEYRGKKFVNNANLREPIGILSDVAPTVLALLGIAPPEDMNGKNLLAQLL
ncbi:MAG: 2,3-bisphosphoglycerate-independent phosphoglycerate mutase [Candidatus Liptonbacteria bacterium]|nr:2,3-bisphosphoglycerate-independent phosphoglycerate mutase [Candidatus Liptonbacteria bacterium]